MRLSYLLEAASAKKQEFLARKFQVDPSIVKQASDTDPTKKGKYVEWIIKRIKDGNIDLNKDAPKISSSLRDFDTISNKKLARQQYNLKDINQYNLEDVVDISTTYQGETGEKPESITDPGLLGVKKFYDDGVYAILEVSDLDSAVKLAGGTKWCTSNRAQAKSYLSRGPLYVIYKNGKKFAQTNGDELKNLRDQEIYDKEVFGILDKAGINASQLYWNYAVKTGERIPEVEPAIMKDPETAFNYAKDIIQGRWPEAEPVIMKDPKSALHYAVFIYDGRWPEAEPYIAQDPRYAYSYAEDIVKGRWPEAEPHIMKDPKYAYQYARNIIKGRWPEAEPAIMKSKRFLTDYVHSVIKNSESWNQDFVDLFTNAGVDVFRLYFDYAISWGKRIPGIEPKIVEDSYLAYEYAKDAIKGRWPEAEPAIMQSTENILDYAEHIIKGRWPEAEPVIMKDPDAATIYAHNVIKGRWPEAEPYIMKSPNLATAYAARVIGGRWPEAEPYIANNGRAMTRYMKRLNVPRSEFNTARVEDKLNKIFGLV